MERSAGRRNSAATRIRSVASTTVNVAWAACTIAALLAALPFLLAASLVSPLARRRTAVLKTVLVLLGDYTHKRRRWRSLAASGDLEAAAAVEAETHRRNAELVYDAIIRLEGLWLKVGQYLSARPDLVPEDYIKVLSRCQDKVVAPSAADMTAIVEEELGGKMDQLFHWVAPEALAAASIASVWKASLRNSEGRAGPDVVIKVQHKWVREKILQDLQDFRAICSGLFWYTKDIDLRPAASELSIEVPKELDFENEAANLARVSSTLRPYTLPLCTPDSNLFTDVVLPKTIEGMVTKKVMVMTYLDGTKITNFAEGAAQRGIPEPTMAQLDSVVRSICRAMATQMLVDGFFNCDPHPGNLLLIPVCSKPSESQEASSSDYDISNEGSEKEAFAIDIANLQSTNMSPCAGAAPGEQGELVSWKAGLLDFGLVKEFSPQLKEQVCWMVLKAAAGDVGGLLDVLLSMGVKFSGTEGDELAGDVLEATQFFFRDSKPADEARAEMRQRVNSSISKRREKMKERDDIKRNPIEAYPEALILFSRSMFLMRGVANVLGSRQRILHDILTPFAVSSLKQVIQPQDHPPPRPPMSDLEAQVIDCITQLCSSGPALGMQVCVIKDGEVICDAASGFLDRFGLGTVGRDSLFPVFSVSKAITAFIARDLALKRRWKLDDSVSKHWPEFSSAPSKKDITIGETLRHRAGLANAGMESMRKNPFVLIDWKRMLAEMETAEPDDATRGSFLYHYLSFGWLVGGAIEKATGTPFEDHVRSYAKGSGIDSEFYMGMTESEQREAAEKRRFADFDMPTIADLNIPQEFLSALPQGMIDTLKQAGQFTTIFNSERVQRAVIPAAGVRASARALARFGDRYIRETHANAESVLGEEHARAGFQSMGATTYGHTGLGGCVLFVDASANLSVAINVNRLVMGHPPTRAVTEIISKAFGIGIDITSSLASASAVSSMMQNYNFGPVGGTAADP